MKETTKNKNPRVVTNADDLPIIESLTEPVKASGGWVAFRIRTQGHTVVETEAICDPSPRNHVLEQLKLEFVRRFVHSQKPS